MYKLYYFPGNANLAPHMVLEEIGAGYELVLVDRKQNAQKSAGYLRLNPSGRIPVLIAGDMVLYEAAAICLHLADRHPEANLAPPVGSTERAHMYKWLMYLTNTVQPELLLYFYPERLTGDEAAAAGVRARAETRVGGMLEILDEALKLTGGPYLLGETYSVVDPYLMMLSRWTRGMGKPAKSYARIGPFLDRLAERPAVRRTFTGEGIEAPWY